jgi:hypothetical protein
MSEEDACKFVEPPAFAVVSYEHVVDEEGPMDKEEILPGYECVDVDDIIDLGIDATRDELATFNKIQRLTLATESTSSSVESFELIRFVVSFNKDDISRLRVGQEIPFITMRYVMEVSSELSPSWTERTSRRLTIRRVK